ncbi:MAG TPA: flagellar export chaperone FliS [Bryobacteraceae bacterium]|jgi:flagellar protein FliS|nr:flagellar export chaperone FliS [Bryobacteraceae bacterium]
MSWKNAYLESRILSASPIDLVNILYEHAILEVREARRNLAAGEVAARSRNIAKAIAIIGELQSSLDLRAGGEIAANLARLYPYLRERLTSGNVQQSDSPLAEVTQLLETLADAWRAINTVSNEISTSNPWSNTPAGQLPFTDGAPSTTAGWSL